MKLFLTGSRSFIGRVLGEQCRARGIAVTGIDTVAVMNDGEHQVDIRSPEVAAVIPEQADALIHLAAISRDADCRKNLKGAFDVNVQGTINLMEAAQVRGVKQFIFASSEWVYGNAEPGEVQTEDSVIDAAKLTSEYALTKVVGERLLYAAHQRGFCPVTILRFAIVYGPRTQPMSAVEGLFQEVKTQDVVEAKPSLRSGRRFLHVADLAAGILASVGQTGFEIFNLSADRLITFGEIIEQSAALWQRQPRVVESNPQALNVRNPDNRKARNILGWEPKIDLATGLRTLMTNDRETTSR